jgi:hypothetical protein
MFLRRVGLRFDDGHVKGNDSMAHPMPLECLELQSMSSGDQSLRLTTRVEWDAFPSYASSVSSLLGGTIVDRADTVVERVWTARIRGAAFWVSFDDFGLGVSIVPKDERASSLILGIRETLVEVRNRQAAE